MRLRSLHLRRLDACDSGIEDFKRVFPKGAPLTARSVRLAKENGFALGWLRKVLEKPTNLCQGACSICTKEKRIYAWAVKRGLVSRLKPLLKGCR